MKVLTSPPSQMTWCIVWARSHSPHHSHHIKWTNPKVWPPYVDLQLPFGWMSGSGKGWGRQTGNHVIMGFCMFKAIKLRVLLHRPYPDWIEMWISEGGGVVLQHCQLPRIKMLEATIYSGFLPDDLFWRKAPFACRHLQLPCQVTLGVPMPDVEDTKSCNMLTYLSGH